LLVALSLGCASDAVAPTGALDEPKQPRAPALQVLAVYRHVNNPFVEYSLLVNSTFELRYGSWASYDGTFKRSDSLITFDFGTGEFAALCSESWCTKWLATGSIRGDTLVVEYDQATSWLLCTDMMDFEICNGRRAVYIRSE
jgi:hypothetical protein